MCVKVIVSDDFVQRGENSKIREIEGGYSASGSSVDATALSSAETRIGASVNRLKP